MAHAAGKYARAISDRSGLEFPYKEMVKEWNGSLVHKSEFESKHPQLESQKHKADAQSLKDGRSARKEPMTVIVGSVSFFENNNSMIPATNNKKPVIATTIGTVTVSTS